jgi:hypothetical protein
MRAGHNTRIARGGDGKSTRDVKHK